MKRVLETVTFGYMGGGESHDIYVQNKEDIKLIETKCIFKGEWTHLIEVTIPDDLECCYVIDHSDDFSGCYSRSYYEIKNGTLSDDQLDKDTAKEKYPYHYANHSIRKELGLEVII